MFDIPQNAGPVEFNTAAIELSAAFENVNRVLSGVDVASYTDVVKAQMDLNNAATWAATAISRIAEQWPVPVIEEELLADADAHAEVYPNIAEGSNG